MKRVFRHIKKAILGYTTVLFIAFIGLLFWISTPSQQVPMWVLAISLFISYGGCILVYAITLNSKEQLYTLPKVLAVDISSTRKITLIVEENEILFYNSLVSIYYHSPETDVETLLGNGFVETIASNKNAQVVFINYIDTTEVNEIIGKFSNSSTTTRYIIVKPSISKSIYEGA
jgi:hypothetical protein